MSTNSTRTAVDQAAQALRDARAKLAQVEAERGAAQVELEELNRRAGGDVLDAPESAGKLSRAMQELRERIELLGRAVAAQEPRVAAARSAYLLAEAAVLEKQVEKARGVLERHEARTAELLALLEEHEGKYVPEVVLINEQRSNPAVLNAPTSWKAPKSELLANAVRKAEQPIRILRQLAAGEDPVAEASDYPACLWGPDALVKAPAYLRSVGERDEATEVLSRG